MKIILILVCLAHISCSSKLTSDLVTSSVPVIENPQIEILEESYYEAVDKSKAIIKGKRLSINGLYYIQTSYNKRNNLLEEKTLIESEFDDDVMCITRHTYDQNGDLTKTVRMENDKSTNTDIYQYDSSRNLVKKCLGVYEHYSVDDFEIRCSSHESCQFNNNDQKTTCWFYESTSLDSPIIESYIYDIFGKLIEIKTQKEKSIYISSKYVRDIHGNTIKKISFDVLGAMIDTKLYTFDKTNNLILWQHFDHNNSLIIQEKYIYNNNGNKTKWYTLDANGKIKTKEIYKYNQLNKVKEKLLIKYVGDDKRTSKYQYFYDDIGNWIKEIEYVEEHPIKITERKIKYF